MFTSSLISGFNNDEVVDWIPETYMAQIRRGELTAVAVYKGNPDIEQTFCGIAVTGVHAGWIEIVYLYFPEDYKEPYLIVDFLLYVIRQAYRRDGGNLVGAFIEMPAEEAYPALETALRMLGMEIREEPGNVYQFTLSEIHEKEALLKAAEKANLRSLEDVDIFLLNRLERQMEEDSRPVAASPLVEWEEYLQDLSLICMENGDPAGLVLISKQGDHLALELVYTVTKTALPKLVGGVLSRAEKLHPELQKVFVPIAVRNSAEILKRIVPTGKRNLSLTGTLWFNEQVVPQEMRTQA